MIPKIDELFPYLPHFLVDQIKGGTKLAPNRFGYIDWSFAVEALAATELRFMAWRS